MPCKSGKVSITVLLREFFEPNPVWTSEFRASGVSRKIPEALSKKGYIKNNQKIKSAFSEKALLQVFGIIVLCPEVLTSEMAEL